MEDSTYKEIDTKENKSTIEEDKTTEEKENIVEEKKKDNVKFDMTTRYIAAGLVVMILITLLTVVLSNTSIDEQPERPIQSEELDQFDDMQEAFNNMVYKNSYLGSYSIEVEQVEDQPDFSTYQKFNLQIDGDKIHMWSDTDGINGYWDVQNNMAYALVDGVWIKSVGVYGQEFIIQPIELKEAFEQSTSTWYDLDEGTIGLKQADGTEWVISYDTETNLINALQNRRKSSNYRAIYKYDYNKVNVEIPPEALEGIDPNETGF